MTDTLAPLGRVVLALPYDRPPHALTANARPHWSARHKAVRQVRSDVAWLGRSAGLRGPYAHLWLTLTWAPGDRRKRDSDNLFPFFKSLVDAVAQGGNANWTGLGLVPDDTDEWVTRRPIVISPPPAERGMWLAIEYAEEAST